MSSYEAAARPVADTPADLCQAARVLAAREIPPATYDVRFVGVGTIRIWLGICVGLLEFEDSFGPAFWISFSLHALAAELWLRARPSAPELAQPTEPALAVT
jgi:hypothetical protein